MSKILSAEFPKSLKTREELAEYLTIIVFTASAQHAAVNFGQVSKRADKLTLPLHNTDHSRVMFYCVASSN